ncbi:IS3 family transposase [Vulcanimicrobium alpinum]|uniref:IS3 family transposase n=1 Tax=Vulcanimicrobium alpinum TaxID=3016050 RepID=UPI00386E3036
MAHRLQPSPTPHRARRLDAGRVHRASSHYPKLTVIRGLTSGATSLMRQMDRIHTDRPHMGARQLRDQLKRLGYRVGRRHVARLTRVM